VTALYLYDDARARTFEPFASTRPFSELVSGGALIRERWRAALQPSETYFISSSVHDHFDESGESQPATGEIPPGSIIANARCVPAIPDDIANIGRRAASCCTSPRWPTAPSRSIPSHPGPAESEMSAAGGSTRSGISSACSPSS